ncbi:MAG TPA: sigma-70 family RNA polymerase sigma factor [Syntrophomonadaceae bacterium]|nr:sigma-70 family RNA polymerase sigma factor [Syntrophomonadaceae bacterium]
MTDGSKLVKHAQQGNRQAFENLVEMYQNRVFSHCYQLTGSYEDAQDLAQEVFIQAFRSLKAFRQEADFGTWLRKITLNLWINTMRKKRVPSISMDEPLSSKNGEIAREIAAGEESPLDKMERNEFNSLVRAALMRLAPDFRSILVLRDVEGYSYEEISTLLKCSLGTVKSRLSRARRDMREEMAALNLNSEEF